MTNKQIAKAGLNMIWPLSIVLLLFGGITPKSIFLLNMCGILLGALLVGISCWLECFDKTERL